jgi:uncharacterized protein (TIGR03663 family)
LANPPPKIRWAVFIALALVALVVRLPQLGKRPMHTDEAVNSWLTGEALAGKPFHYDPQDRHGPALFLLAAPVAKLCGAGSFSELTESQLRTTPVLASCITVLLFGAAVEMFGFLPCVIAALLFAIAPLPVYYSRYFIHETLFVGVTFAFLIWAWKSLAKRSSGLAALAGLCAALMCASKETAVIHLFALGIAGLVGWLTMRRMETPPTETLPARTSSLRMLLTAGLVFITSLILLFTWFGQNWGVLTDLLRAIPNFLARAGGAGHEKPFTYYLGILDPAVFFFILAVAGVYMAICQAVDGSRRATLLLAVYGVVTLLIYSLIPYKTPWLALNLWLPMALLCGLGIEGIWQQFKSPSARWVGGVFITALCLVAGNQTKTLAFDHPSDEKNPLAYAHTGDDLLRLAPRLEKLAAERQLAQPLIAVVAADPWPLPWYLRHFQKVGFWQPGQDPGPADFYLTSPEAAESIEAHLKDRYLEFFGLRPEVLLLLWSPPLQATNHAP